MQKDGLNTQTDNVSPTIIETAKGATDGQNKCPKCGATEIELNTQTGKLRCLFCRNEFDAENISGVVDDVSQLKGQVLGSGAQDIIADVKDVLTFKCSSCGAEVVVDTSSSMQARCHWCRNTLSVNEQIPNGSVPDVVLPFSINKEDARVEIEKFVGKRKFFANPKFKEEFTTENIMGVYFPYMIVDINGHVNMTGNGEHLVRKYYRGTGDNQKAYYDADLYYIEREFDIAINDLSIESSSDRLNQTSKEKTNNIINAVMPFDTDKVVKYKANYLSGYTSEKRDTNINDLKPIVKTQAQDIARYAANDTLTNYDRGVLWSKEDFTIIGEQWLAAYLPIWLYSYQEVKGSKKLLHYVAVNGRTKKTMGSVPIHMPKLIIVSALVELVCLALTILLALFIDSDYIWSLLAGGFIFYLIMFLRYRNSNARHTYEKETQREMTNLRKTDTFVRRLTGLTNHRMNGANNTLVNGTNNKSFINNFNGTTLKNDVITSMTEDNPIASFIKKKIDKK